VALAARTDVGSVTVWPVSEFTVEDDTVAARAADVRQANYYRSELAHQRDLLGEQMTVYEAALARYQLRGDTNQMHRGRSA
jgi:hypothetical protein